MFDYWNDPPDNEPELPPCPKCAGEETDFAENGESLICYDCGNVWPPSIEPDPEPEDFAPIKEEWPPNDEYPPEPTVCLHGNQHGDCGACDHAADIEYDARRERGRR